MYGTSIVIAMTLIAIFYILAWLNAPMWLFGVSLIVSLVIVPFATFMKFSGSIIALAIVIGILDWLSVSLGLFGTSLIVILYGLLVVRQDRIRTIKGLIAEGYNISTNIGYKELLFIQDTYSHYIKTIKICLHEENNAVPENIKEIALMIASEKGYTEIVNLLLTHNTNVNTSDDNGVTPLMKAASNGNKEIIKLLIRHGAEKNMINNNGSDALMIALDRGHKEAAELLQRYIKLGFDIAI